LSFQLAIGDKVSPADLRKNYPNAYLSMTNIRYGLIGKTLEEDVYENLQKVE
jgi:hypothetical protein